MYICEDYYNFNKFMLHLNKNISDEIIFFHFITLFHNKN